MEKDYAASQKKAERDAEEDLRRRAEAERRAALEAEEAERREERLRAQEEKEHATALAPQWDAEADAEARRLAEQEHIAALNAEQAALEREREALRVAERKALHRKPKRADDERDEKPTPFTELPLYSWANYVEEESKARAEPD